MKKFLSFLLLGALTFGFTAVTSEKANAQSSSSPKIKTITAADTVVFTSVPSNLVSIQYSYKETSGATAGKIYLEATDDPTSGLWKALDSVTLADNTNPQGIIYPITITHYLNYRFRNTNTSGATGSTRSLYARRTDEAK